uniref:Integrase, catalytic region, zinc finger, CCHC-type, peptidase aspartic, catalytic n=1 Tax=Tanacetum cinerariifolium TaxID=118510 RepID=A0A6L2NXS9_TANCI|nr:integrase, catalytic region, zinc finger, CCHC-type, peptidase aspartic, catalytic [Tanacetum cinerariifolium]
MRGSEYSEQDRKAAILYEYDTFKAIEGEQFLDTYLRYLQVINDLKKCGYKKDNCELNYKFLNNLQQEWKQYATLMRQTKNLMDINIDALYNILKQNQRDVNDALGYKKKAVVVHSDPLALVAEKTNVSKRKKKVVVFSDSEGSGSDDFSELKKIIALLAKAFNRRKFYSKPTNNNLRTSSTSQSANKKQEFVKIDNKKVEKKDDEKKRDMSRVKCYNCKKEGHFAKDCKKVKVKDYEYYTTKMLLANKDKDEQVLLAEDQACMESSSVSDQEINANMVFMAQIEKILSDSEASSSSADEKISEVSYYLFESECESEFETSEYYDNSTNFGLFVNNDDDQEIFHDAIESASENFIENHIDSQKDYDKSYVDHNDSEEKDHLVDKLIRKYNKKIVKCQKQKNNEFNEQIKVLNEKNDDLLDQTKVLKDQLQVKHIVIDTHVECRGKYAKLEADRYEYMIRYFALFDNDKQHRKQIADQEVLFDNMSVELVELDKHDLEMEKCLERLNVCENKHHKMGQTNQNIHMIMPSKDNLYNGRKGIGFECPSYFGKAKDLRPTLYDEKVIGLGSESENQIENDCLVVEKEYDKEENPKKKVSSNTSNVGLSAVSVANLNKNVKRYSRKDLLACNNSHLGETCSAYMCNDDMNVSCDSMMNDLLDDNNFFIFDDESVKISPVSKMPFRKKPRDSMNVRSKSNSNKSLPRTVHKWLPKVQLLAEPVAKWFPKIVQIFLWVIDSGCSKHMTGNRVLLTNFVEKFLGTVRFSNNDFVVIAGFGDVVIGSLTIKKDYYVEGLRHNLFSVGQFCDKGLEVAFRNST